MTHPPSIDHRTRRLINAAVVVCALFAVVAALLTWPSERSDETFNFGADLYAGRVQQVSECPPDLVPEGAQDIACETVSVQMHEGPDAGQLFELPPFFEARTSFAVGDELMLARVEGDDAPFRYAFSDRNRASSLLALTLLFAVTVVLLGRLRGASALAGLASSILILGFYTLPALLEGQSALVIACVSAALIALVALYTSHGFTPMTTVAVLGTLSALALTTALGVLVIDLTELSGFASEESLFIEGVGDVDVRGLLLAGLVIGALGALDDMTVTQASVVFELRRANPRQSQRQLSAAAMRVGRDHVASTVNTLFLAYAGASLPLLLLFSVGRVPAVDVANSEVVATEIVRTLVGSIGLVASVPLTTWLAVFVAGRPDPAPRVKAGERPPVRRTGPTLTSAVSPAEPGSDDEPDAPSGDSDVHASSRSWTRLREGIDD